jgi:hypothetical protein
MESEDVSLPTDFDLVSPISLPPDGRVPDPETGAATPDEYDRYFRIRRDTADLASWSESCLDLTETVLDELRESCLDDADQRDILRGFVIVLQTTLARWVAASHNTTHREEELKQ